SIQSSITTSKLSRLSKKKPSSPVLAIAASKPSPFRPLASARAVLASSSISKALTFDTVKLRLHPAKDADSEENFRSARCAVFVILAKSGDEHDFNSESCFGLAPEFRGSVSILAQVRFH